MTKRQAVQIATVAALDAIIARCAAVERGQTDFTAIKNDLGQLSVIVRRLVTEAKRT